MILVPNKNIWTPSIVKGPKFQRGAIMMAGAGTMASTAAAEVITLTGSTGSPNMASDFAISPDDAIAGWFFNTDGTVDRNNLGSISQFSSGVQWSDFQPTPGKDYWIRATINVGTNPNVGDALNSWLKLAGSGAGNRQWQWEITGLGSFTNDSVKVEIAEDSGGSTIVATGYYGISDVSVEV